MRVIKLKYWCIYIYITYQVDTNNTTGGGLGSGLMHMDMYMKRQVRDRERAAYWVRWGWVELLWLQADESMHFLNY